MEFFSSTESRFPKAISELIDRSIRESSLFIPPWARVPCSCVSLVPCLHLIPWISHTHLSPPMNCFVYGFFPIPL